MIEFLFFKFTNIIIQKFLFHLKHYNSSQDYPISGDNGNSLIYGFGPGIFFKTSKMIGINMEAQFNKLLHTENHGSYEVSGGFFSLKAGIIYTIF